LDKLGNRQYHVLSIEALRPWRARSIESATAGGREYSRPPFLLRSARHPRWESIHLWWNVRKQENPTEIQRPRLKGDHFTYSLWSPFANLRKRPQQIEGVPGWPLPDTSEKTLISCKFCSSFIDCEGIFMELGTLPGRLALSMLGEALGAVATTMHRG
jgi:hypothetical protein